MKYLIILLLFFCQAAHAQTYKVKAFKTGKYGDSIVITRQGKDFTFHPITGRWTEVDLPLGSEMLVQDSMVIYQRRLIGRLNH